MMMMITMIIKMIMKMILMIMMIMIMIMMMLTIMTNRCAFSRNQFASLAQLTILDLSNNRLSKVKITFRFIIIINDKLELKRKA